MNSLIQEYDTYRSELFGPGKDLPGGVPFMLRSKLESLFAAKNPDDIRAFARHAEENGYLSVERDAIRSAAQDVLTE